MKEIIKEEDDERKLDRSDCTLSEVSEDSKELADVPSKESDKKHVEVVHPVHQS